MENRNLLHDKTIKGWRCDTCGWAWPTPRWLRAEQNADRACQEDFGKHECSKYPLPRKELVDYLTTRPEGEYTITGQSSVKVVDDPFGKPRIG
jgi:hypothetical protein